MAPLDHKLPSPFFYSMNRQRCRTKSGQVRKSSREFTNEQVFLYFYDRRKPILVFRTRQVNLITFDRLSFWYNPAQPSDSAYTTRSL